MYAWQDEHNYGENYLNSGGVILFSSEIGWYRGAVQDNNNKIHIYLYNAMHTPVLIRYIIGGEKWIQ